MTPLFVCWMQGFGEGDGLVVGALIAGAFSLVLQSLSALFARPAAGTPDLPAELRPAFAEVRSAAARLFLAFHVVKDLRGKEQTMAEIKLSWDALEIVRDAFLLQADRFEQNAYRWHGSPPFSPEPMPGSPFYVLPENGMPASAEQRQ